MKTARATKGLWTLPGTIQSLVTVAGDVTVTVLPGFENKFVDGQFIENTMSESLRFLGSLEGHKGWVTAIATSSENPDMILTASRGMLPSSSLFTPFNQLKQTRQDHHCLAIDSR